MPVLLYTQQEVDDLLATVAAGPPGPAGPVGSVGPQGAAGPQGAVGPAGPAGGSTYRQPAVWDFFRNAQAPMLSGYSTTYAFSGASTTGQCMTFPAEMGIWPHWANLIITWRPNVSTGVGGVRLVMFDGGPVNIVALPGCTFERAATNPTPERVDITQALRDIITASQASGIGKYLGIQMRGNGSQRVELYSASIESVWL